MLWDLSHAARGGAQSISSMGADLAVGCTYKYLSAGPGAPAFLYVRRALQARCGIPSRAGSASATCSRWARRTTGAGIRAWLAGTPGILAVAAVEEGVRITAEAGMTAIRTKSTALTQFGVELLDERLAPLGCTLGSPRDPEGRGAHIAIRHPRAKEVDRPAASSAA